MAEQASRAGGPGTAQGTVLSRALSVLGAFVGRAWPSRHFADAVAQVSRRLTSGLDRV